MDQFKFSWDDLPGWLSVVLIVLYVLRTHIQRGYEFLFRTSEDTREHRQELEEAKLNSELQDKATLRLRQIQLENQAMVILKENLEWSRSQFSDMEHQLRGIHHAQNRNNDLMTMHNRMIVELIEEIKELVKEVKKFNEKNI